MNFRPLHLPGCIVLGLLAGSCSFFGTAPGTTVVSFYNHSGHTVLVENHELRPNRDATLKYPYDPGHAVIVFWNGCVHAYIAPQRKPDSFKETDWMLRGAYRTQLEPDGRLYLVPPGVTIPADPASLKQPEGFPLRPGEGSSCLQSSG